MKEKILAREELIVDCKEPEWHLFDDENNVNYLIDFGTTKRLVFKMGNGKTYFFSLVRWEEDQ